MEKDKNCKANISNFLCVRIFDFENEEVGLLVKKDQMLQKGYLELTHKDHK